MTKQELVELFPMFSPKRAFRDYGAPGSVDGYEVCGKYVRAVRLHESTYWDVFVCNTRDMSAGLGQKRVNALAALVPEGVRVRVVDGEAWWQSCDFNLVRGWLERNRVRLGIAKRMVLSESDREARRALVKMALRRRKAEAEARGSGLL